MSDTPRAMWERELADTEREIAECVRRMHAAPWLSPAWKKAHNERESLMEHWLGVALEMGRLERQA